MAIKRFFFVIGARGTEQIKWNQTNMIPENRAKG
jgi:hypothetical protein